MIEMRVNDSKQYVYVMYVARETHEEDILAARQV